LFGLCLMQLNRLFFPEGCSQDYFEKLTLCEF
jgi:hypothetical protein